MNFSRMLTLVFSSTKTAGVLYARDVWFDSSHKKARAQRLTHENTESACPPRHHKKEKRRSCGDRLTAKQTGDKESKATSR